MRMPWNKSRTVSEDRAALIEGALRGLEKRIADLEGRVPEGRSLRMEFEDLQDKVYRWMQKTSQRVRREAAAAEVGDEPAANGTEAPQGAAGFVPREVIARRGLYGLSA